MSNLPRVAIPIPTVADREYNLRSWPAYAEAVRQAGGTPVEIPLNLPERDLTTLIATCEATLLPGSGADVSPARYAQQRLSECNPADPVREAVDLRLLEDAYHYRKPLFCICFGTQILNVWRGGTLVQHLPPLPVNHRAPRGVIVAHSSAVVRDSRLAAVTDALEAPLTDDFLRLPVNSSHHQSVATVGDGLRIAARCPQDGVLEALEGTDPAHYVLAVQWHPERTTTESQTSRNLFMHFLRQVR